MIASSRMTIIGADHLLVHEQELAVVVVARHALESVTKYGRCTRARTACPRRRSVVVRTSPSSVMTCADLGQGVGDHVANLHVPAAETAATLASSSSKTSLLSSLRTSTAPRPSSPPVSGTGLVPPRRSSCPRDRAGEHGGGGGAVAREVVGLQAAGAPASRPCSPRGPRAQPPHRDVVVHDLGEPY